jgi:hypothetical protein
MNSRKIEKKLTNEVDQSRRFIIFQGNPEDFLLLTSSPKMPVSLQPQLSKQLEKLTEKECRRN